MKWNEFLCAPLCFVLPAVTIHSDLIQSPSLHCLKSHMLKTIQIKVVFFFFFLNMTLMSSTLFHRNWRPVLQRVHSQMFLAPTRRVELDMQLLLAVFSVWEKIQTQRRVLIRCFKWTIKQQRTWCSVFLWKVFSNPVFSQLLALFA